MTESGGTSAPRGMEAAALPLDRYVDSCDEALREAARRPALAAAEPVVTEVARLGGARYVVRSRFVEQHLERLLAAGPFPDSGPLAQAG